jgi:uncharacterized protein (TIGR04222 family)
MGVNELKGPEFLLFYALFCAGVTLLLVLLRRRLEDGPRPSERVDTSDPYRLALLRGGRVEAVRLAMVRLIDGGWLALDDEAVSLAESRPTEALTHPLEAAVFNTVAQRGVARVGQIADAPEVKGAAALMAGELRREGLLPGAGAWGVRVGLVLVGAAIVVGVAVHRLDLAAARGRHNTGGLHTLVVFAPAVLAWAVLRARRTRRGDRTLAELRTLVEAAPAPDVNAPLTQDAMLLAAVVGIAALPMASFAYGRVLFPPARFDGSSSGCGWSSSCGSGGGGDSGGGGGDGGGGGCGGGCGGCGGGCGG